MVRKKSFKERYGWTAKKIKFYRVFALKKGDFGAGYYRGSIRASNIKEAEKKAKKIFTKFYFSKVRVQMEEYPMPDGRVFKVIGD